LLLYILYAVASLPGVGSCIAVAAGLLLAHHAVTFWFWAAHHHLSCVVLLGARKPEEEDKNPQVLTPTILEVVSLQCFKEKGAAHL
jgi:hypothetical protein